MDGMLSQDEINALLNGMDLTIDDESDESADAAGSDEVSICRFVTSGCIGTLI